MTNYKIQGLLSLTLAMVLVAVGGCNGDTEPADEGPKGIRSVDKETLEAHMAAK